MLVKGGVQFSDNRKEDLERVDPTVIQNVGRAEDVKKREENTDAE